MIYIFEENISAFKVFVGGAVNQSLEMQSLAPSIEEAFCKYVELWLGEEQWQELVTDVAADDLSAEQEKLLPYLRKTIAYLSIYEYAQTGSVQLTESGLMRAESEHLKTAFKYQVNGFEQSALINGFEALERMIFFLKKNEGDYPLWVASEGYQEAYALFINEARVFRRFYSFQISRYTFEYLRGLMKDLDLFVAEACFGEAFTTDLKAKLKAGTLSTKEKTLVQFTQRAIAKFAIEEAMRRNLVQLDGNNVTIREALEPQSYEKESLPNATQFSISIRHHQEWGTRLWNKAKKYLEDNKADFPLYEEYLETLEEVECAAREKSSALKTFDYGFSTGAKKKIVSL